jgi:hypothetical protein
MYMRTEYCTAACFLSSRSCMYLGGIRTCMAPEFPP